MSGRRIELPLDCVSLSAAMVDALIQKGSSDAALLYLYLLRHDGYFEPEEAQRALHWSQLRLDEGMTLLGELGIKTQVPQPIFTPELPKKEEVPDYSQSDLAQVISDHHTNFSYLLETVQQMLGKPLTDRETRMLLEIVDHVQLPDEVIVLLVQWQCEEYSKKHGESRRPPMSLIRSAAYRWKRSGVETLEDADAYLKKLNYFRTQEGEMLNAVGITGREALDTERRSLHQWMDWGFPPESVALAFERTIYNTGKFNWAYCTAILKRWHQAGLHSPQEIRSKDQSTRRSGKVSAGPAPAQPLSAREQESRSRALEENQRELKKLLASVGGVSDD